MEKSDGYIHVFTCSQASGSSGNFSWRHMQTGSRNPPKPEVVIARRRKDISTWSQRTTHFLGMSDLLPLASTLSDYGEHYQVQTGSRNSIPNRKYYWLSNGNRYRRNPTVQTRRDCRQLVANSIHTADATQLDIYLCFWEQDFHWCTCQPNPMLPTPRNFKTPDGYRK